MNYRLALIAFALIPLSLMQSCSTRPTVKENVAAHGAGSVPETSPAPRAFSGSKEPGYGHGDDGLDDAAALFGTFPRPKTLEPQVKFWRNVYSTWGRSQVAIHDDLYLNVVYEVLDLPGFNLEGMTASQKDYVNERMAYWRDRLQNLEAKVSSRLPLSSDDQRVANLFAQNEEGLASVQGASERLRYQRGIREKFRRGLELSGMYESRFREIFRRAGLPEDLAYLPHVESSYQANARSSAGALGVWQFTAGAARMFMNGDDSVRARLDPIASAYGAARYLSYAYGKLGSWPLAVTSYNHGIGGMQRAKTLYGQNFSRIVKDYDHPLFGFASRNYYAEFLAAREIASQPERFFPEGVTYAKNADWSISRLADESDTAVSAAQALARDMTPSPRQFGQARRSVVVKQTRERGHAGKLVLAKGHSSPSIRAGLAKSARFADRPLKGGTRVAQNRVPHSATQSRLRAGAVSARQTVARGVIKPTAQKAVSVAAKGRSALPVTASAGASTRATRPAATAPRKTASTGKTAGAAATRSSASQGVTNIARR